MQKKPGSPYLITFGAYWLGIVIGFVVLLPVLFLASFFTQLLPNGSGFLNPQTIGTIFIIFADLAIVSALVVKTVLRKRGDSLAAVTAKNCLILTFPALILPVALFGVPLVARSMSESKKKK